MSVDKLLQRIVSPDIDVQDNTSHNAGGPDNTPHNARGQDVHKDLHDFTHGITSDPLTQFSVVFSALVHDADHRGVSNVQLSKEDVALAEKYRSKSVAEQNSIDLAWELLMKPQYRKFRQCIYGTEEELKRFRQLSINIVLATDIFDGTSKTLSTCACSPTSPSF